MPPEDAKPAKHEEGEDQQEDEMSLSSILDRKKKVGNGDAASPSGSRPKLAKVKKEENLGDVDDLDYKPVSRKISSATKLTKQTKVKKEKLLDDDLDDDKPISRRNSSNSATDKQQKKKKKKKGDRTAAREPVENGRKREKKVYDLPGQKRDPPEDRDPLRIFYESLYKQVPESEMARIWMMESGLLSKEEAKKIYDKKQRKNLPQKLGSPVEAIARVKKSNYSVTVQKKTQVTKTSSVSSKKVKTTEAKSVSKQSKKRKITDDSGDEGPDYGDDDFIVREKPIKKLKAP